MSVKVQHLSKIYGSQKAVDDISFEVTKGEVVGFLGPNGAGKSTTMKIISCYTLPSSGSVTVHGTDILEDPIRVRKSIGYLPEQNPVYEDMYVEEYLLFVARLHQIREKYTARVEEMISLTGLTAEKHKKIGALSKGYRQRIGLAQSLIHDPEVLLLDEPTSGLDPNQVVEIRKLIIDIGKEKTVILSSHVMQEIQAMCNRVIIIDKGRIVADDKTENLVKASGSRIILSVEFKNPVNVEELKKLSGVEQVEKRGKYWVLRMKNEKVREQVFRYATEKGNIILEMKSETENLETVFQQLTSSKNQ